MAWEQAECRARAEYYAGFSQYVEAIPEGKAEEATPGENRTVLTDEEIGALLVQAEGLAAWFSDLQAYAREAILAGRIIPGWKVVEGKKIRAFTDTDAAMEKMRGAGYDDAVLYDRKPKTLAQLEKLTGKKQFAEIMGDLITWPPGKPTLVGADDKREAYAPVGPNEFAGVTDG